jgi:beta-glucosidase
MIEAIYLFPKGFLWGTATSSHQVEGQNKNNDWWEWEQEPGRILEGHRSELACDWWGGRWEQDFDKAVEGGQNAHRLSIEWSRVEPKPGEWDQDAIAFYREIIEGAIARGLTPMVTLHHFTNPRWFMELGGWTSPQSAALFERYTREVVTALGELVPLWVTINEPNVYFYEAYLEGVFPPGEQSWEKVFQVIENLARAHAAAYYGIHEIQPEAQVGVAHYFRGMEPSRKWNPLDRMVCRIRSRNFNDVFPVLLSTGSAPFLVRRIRVPEAKGTVDFFGLNYYTSEEVAFDLRHLKQLFGRGYFPENADLSPTSFIANEPQGFWKALKWAKSFRKPIYITENGIEDAADEIRPRYLCQHLRQVWRAVNFNWDVHGYFHWSLVDNFEWDRGWTQRFGLWELDVDSQERRERASAALYAAICHANGLSSEMVSTYAPEVMDALFPGDEPGELSDPEA